MLQDADVRSFSIQLSTKVNTQSNPTLWSKTRNIWAYISVCSVDAENSNHNKTFLTSLNNKLMLS